MNLFVYGTLIIPEVYEAITGFKREYLEGFLPGFRRVKLKNANYPGLISETGYILNGKLVLDIRKGELERLTYFEGDMYEMQFAFCFVNEKKYSCGFYLLKPKYHHLVQYTDWCENEFRQHHLDQFMQRL